MLFDPAFSSETSMDWNNNNNSYVTFRMADKCLQQLLCNTVTIEIRLMYIGGIQRMERRCFVWNPSIFRRCALFSHIACRQYNNFRYGFFLGMQSECRQALANLLNCSLVSPSRMQISGSAAAFAYKKTSVRGCDVSFAADWQYFAFSPVEVKAMVHSFPLLQYISYMFLLATGLQPPPPMYRQHKTIHWQEGHRFVRLQLHCEYCRRVKKEHGHHDWERENW